MLCKLCAFGFVFCLQVIGFAQSPGLQVLKYEWDKERYAWDDPFGAPNETFNEMTARVRVERRPRSALEERSIQQAREENKRPNPPPRYFFNYRITVENKSSKKIAEIDWDYVFLDSVTGEEVGRQEFTSVESVGARKKKELRVRASRAPTSTISAHNLGKNERAGLVEKVVIVRILYEDGSVWTAPDTNTVSPSSRPDPPFRR